MFWHSCLYVETQSQRLCVRFGIGPVNEGPRAHGAMPRHRAPTQTV